MRKQKTHIKESMNTVATKVQLEPGPFHTFQGSRQQTKAIPTLRASEKGSKPGFMGLRNERQKALMENVQRKFKHQRAIQEKEVLHTFLQQSMADAPIDSPPSPVQVPAPEPKIHSIQTCHRSALLRTQEMDRAKKGGLATLNPALQASRNDEVSNSHLNTYSKERLLEK